MAESRRRSHHPPLSIDSKIQRRYYEKNRYLLFLIRQYGVRKDPIKESDGLRQICLIRMGAGGQMALVTGIVQIVAMIRRHQKQRITGSPGR